MPILIKKSAAGFLLPPPGLYEVIIADVKEEKKRNNFTKVYEDLIIIKYVIMDTVHIGNKITGAYTPTITPTSTLYRVCCAAMGRPFKPEELATIRTVIDLRKFLLFTPLQLLIINKISKKKTKYYKIQDYAETKLIYENAQNSCIRAMENYDPYKVMKQKSDDDIPKFYPASVEPNKPEMSVEEELGKIDKMILDSTTTDKS